MTARIIEQTMTDTREYPWHPRKPKHRAGDEWDWLASLSLVPVPTDPWPNNRRD